MNDLPGDVCSTCSDIVDADGHHRHRLEVLLIVPDGRVMAKTIFSGNRTSIEEFIILQNKNLMNPSSIPYQQSAVSLHKM